MQVAFYLAGEITQVKESIPWVRCASVNVCLKTSLTTVLNVCWRVTKISYQVNTKLHQRVCPMSPIQPHDVYIYLILTSFDISLFFKTENGIRDVCSTAFPNVSIHFTTVSRCPAKVFSESKILYAPILIF